MQKSRTDGDTRGTAVAHQSYVVARGAARETVSEKEFPRDRRPPALENDSPRDRRRPGAE
jgi:hypothetical protein